MAAVRGVGWWGDPTRMRVGLQLWLQPAHRYQRAGESGNVQNSGKQARAGACSKGRLLMQNRKENTGKIGANRGVAAVMVY